MNLINLLHVCAWVNDKNVCIGFPCEKHSCPGTLCSCPLPSSAVRCDPKHCYGNQLSKITTLTPRARTRLTFTRNLQTIYAHVNAENTPLKLYANALQAQGGLKPQRQNETPDALSSERAMPQGNSERRVLRGNDNSIILEGSGQVDGSSRETCQDLPGEDCLLSGLMKSYASCARRRRLRNPDSCHKCHKSVTFARSAPSYFNPYNVRTMRVFVQG